MLRESSPAVAGAHEDRLPVTRHPAHRSFAELHFRVARGRREAETGPAPERLRLRLVEEERYVVGMERAGHAAHGDLENGVQRKIHVEAVPELEEGGQLGKSSARLLQLHLLAHEPRAEAVDLGLLMQDVEAEEDREPHETHEEHPSARRQVVPQES